MNIFDFLIKDILGMDDDLHALYRGGEKTID